jgi:CreA protein
MRTAAAVIAASLAIASPASAADADTIGTVTTSGILFKDSIAIKAFDDPDYPGIVCYVTMPDRSLSWDDPSDTSISCRLVGERPKSPAARADVFSEAKNPFFKVTRVDRFYDAKRDVLVYLSYTRKSSGENHSHSNSVVPLRSLD